ncbi:MAG: PIN domain-containing protein [Bacteroidia bacterium]
MNNILLDTNILIYLLHGDKTVRDMLEEKTWYISFVNEMELLMKPNVEAQELKAIEALLKECIIIEMNSAVKKQAILNGRRFRMKLADSIVLAAAQINNIPLLTADAEFKKASKDNNDVLLYIP